MFSTTLNDKKPLERSLQAVYGIGLFRARAVCGRLGLNPQTVTNTLHPLGFDRVRQLIESEYSPRHLAERVQAAAILEKVKMGSYQGIRHAQALPVRGQRTQTNARTQKKMGRQRQVQFQIPYFNKKKPLSAHIKPVLTTLAQQEQSQQSQHQAAQRGGGGGGKK